jgi:hypothetical protein
MSSTRNQKLQEISTFVVHGCPTFKLDFIGTISIHGRDYFNVFRRYNNVYEFVFEDYHGELHYHKDYTVIQSLQRLLCLSDEQMRGIHVLDVYSIKHSGDPTISDSFLDMRWSAIQGTWYGLMMNLGGILDYDSVTNEALPDAALLTHQEPVHESSSMMNQHSVVMNDIMDEMYARFDNQDQAIDYCLRMVDDCRREIAELRSEYETPNSKNTVHFPDAPEKALRCVPYRCTQGGNGTKRQRLTDRFAELEEKDEKEEKEWSNDVVVEISGSEETDEEEEDEETDEDEDEEDEEEEEEEEEEETDEEEEESQDEDSNYLQLRSGVKYYK